MSDYLKAELESMSDAELLLVAQNAIMNLPVELIDGYPAKLWWDHLRDEARKRISSRQELGALWNIAMDFHINPLAEEATNVNSKNCP